MIAIKRSDGKIECSPFHVKLVRVGKGKKVVKLKVNGKSVSLSMKLGSAGEAFFIEKKTSSTRPRRGTFCSHDNDSVDLKNSSLLSSSSYDSHGGDIGSTNWYNLYYFKITLSFITFTGSF